MNNECAWLPRDPSFPAKRPPTRPKRITCGVCSRAPVVLLRAAAAFSPAGGSLIAVRYSGALSRWVPVRCAAGGLARQLAARAAQEEWLQHRRAQRASEESIFGDEDGGGGGGGGSMARGKQVGGASAAGVGDEGGLDGEVSEEHEDEASDSGEEMGTGGIGGGRADDTMSRRREAESGRGGDAAARAQAGAAGEGSDFGGEDDEEEGDEDDEGDVGGEAEVVWKAEPTVRVCVCARHARDVAYISCPGIRWLAWSAHRSRGTLSNAIPPAA